MPPRPSDPATRGVINSQKHDSRRLVFTLVVSSGLGVVNHTNLTILAQRRLERIVDDLITKGSGNLLERFVSGLDGG